MTRLELAALERDARRMRAEEIRRLLLEATAAMRSIVAKAMRREPAKESAPNATARV